MIAGIGIDVVDINRFKTTFMHERRLEKVFTEREIAYAKDKFDPFVHYAGMWAAKESYKKASGWTELDMLTIEVMHYENGKPYLDLHGFLGSVIPFLSISHDGNYAAATVVLQHAETAR